MENISLPENERAAKVQTYTLTSVITAMVCAGSISITTVILVLVSQTSDRLRLIMQAILSFSKKLTDAGHRQPRARSEPEPKNGYLSAKLLQMHDRLGATWIQETITINGFEPVLFDRFLRFQAILFGLSATILTPTVATFNYCLGQQRDALDPLDRLGWRNLSAAEAKLYWLYTALVFAFAVFVQSMITRELKQTLLLRSRLLNQNCTERCVTYYVAVQGLSKDHQDEREVRNICGQWQTHVKYVMLLPHHRRLYDLLDRRRRYVQAIEWLEARFIAQMVRKRASCRSLLALKHELIDRYQGLSSSWLLQWLSRCWSFMPYSFQNVASLYEGLIQVSREHEEERSRATNCPAAILAVDSSQVARLLSEYHTSVEHATTKMRYLGSSPSQIIVPNVARSPAHHDICDEGIKFSITILVILWSIPMGASGFVSQLNAAFPLLGRVDGLGIPEWVIGLIQGALPQLMTSALMMAMLGLLRVLTRWQRCLSRAEVQSNMRRSYFWFLFTQLFITTSLSSGLIPTAAKMLDQGLWELPRTLAENLPSAGSYYLAYIPLQTALELASAVVRAPTLVQQCFRRSRWRPPRQLLRTFESQQSGTHLGEAYPHVTTIAVIVVIYALFSPLILPIAALCAAVSRVRFRYALTYVSKVPSQTNGELYMQSLFDLFWGVLVMELGFIGLFLLKLDLQNARHDVAQITLLTLLLYCTWRYRKRIVSRYGDIAKGQEASILGGLAARRQETITPHEHDFAPGVRESRDLPVNRCVIWIARDSMGISDALVGFVRSRFSRSFNGEEFITNRHAELDVQGNVTFDVVFDSDANASTK